MRRPPVGRILVALLFTFLGLSAFREAYDGLFVGGPDNPFTIGVLQTIVGATALATAAGSWLGARWAPLAAVAYGVITGGMIVALGPILKLDADARGGLVTGGVAVFLIGLATAWYLRRSLRRAPLSGKS